MTIRLTDYKGTCKYYKHRGHCTLVLVTPGVWKWTESALTFSFLVVANSQIDNDYGAQNKKKTITNFLMKSIFDFALYRRGVYLHVIWVWKVFSLYSLAASPNCYPSLGRKESRV